MGLFQNIFARQNEPLQVFLTPKAAALVRTLAAEEKSDLEEGGFQVRAMRGGGIEFEIVARVTPTIAVLDGLVFCHSEGIRVIVAAKDVAAVNFMEIDAVGRAFIQESFTYATLPGEVRIDYEKLCALNPVYRDHPHGRAFAEELEYKTMKGCCGAAVIVSVQPLVICAHADDLDGVVLLEFPEELVSRYRLRRGLGLLCVSTFSPEPARDIVLGPNHTKLWYNFEPVIADFVASDAAHVLRRKQALDKDLWARVLRLGDEAIVRASGRYRNGRPPFSGESAW